MGLPLFPKNLYNITIIQWSIGKPNTLIEIHTFFEHEKKGGNILCTEQF